MWILNETVRQAAGAVLAYSAPEAQTCEEHQFPRNRLHVTVVLAKKLSH